MSEMVLLSPCRGNPNAAVVGSVLDMPPRRQVIEREFVFQDIPDGDDVPDERLDGSVPYLREFFRHCSGSALRFLEPGGLKFHCWRTISRKECPVSGDHRRTNSCVRVFSLSSKTNQIRPFGA